MSSLEPLDVYRKQANYGVTDIQNYFEDEDCVRLKKEMFDTLEKDPLFRPSEDEITGQMSLDAYRHLSHLRMKKWVDYEFVTDEKMMQYPLLNALLALDLGSISWEILARNGLSANVR